MSRRLNWDLNWRGDDVAQQIEAATTAALTAAAHHLKRDAQEATPVRSGALRDSAEVEVDGDTATVTFGTKGRSARGRPTKYYAIPNHEKFRYEHPGGGTAKYFGRNLRESDDEFSVMADVLRKAHDD